MIPFPDNKNDLQSFKNGMIDQDNTIKQKHLFSTFSSSNL